MTKCQGVGVVFETKKIFYFFFFFFFYFVTYDIYIPLENCSNLTFLSLGYIDKRHAHDLPAHAFDKPSSLCSLFDFVLYRCLIMALYSREKACRTIYIVSRYKYPYSCAYQPFWGCITPALPFLGACAHPFCC